MAEKTVLMPVRPSKTKKWPPSHYILPLYTKIGLLGHIAKRQNETSRVIRRIDFFYNFVW